MKHEQPEHFQENDTANVLKTAREDQIKRLLQDIGFLPHQPDDAVNGQCHDQV